MWTLAERSYQSEYPSREPKTLTDPQKPQSIAACPDLSEGEKKNRFVSCQCIKCTGVCCDALEECFSHTNLCDCPQVEQAIWPPGQDILSLCKPVRHAVFSILSPSRKVCEGQGQSLLLPLGGSSVMDRQVIDNPWVSKKQGGGKRDKGNWEGDAFIHSFNNQ